MPLKHCPLYLQDDNRLWITGGYDGRNEETSTDIYIYTESTGQGRFDAGPELPRESYEHCMVKLNNDEFMFLGGFPYSVQTW